jgi:hypothetical protein
MIADWLETIIVTVPPPGPFVWTHCAGEVVAMHRMKRKKSYDLRIGYLS